MNNKDKIIETYNQLKGQLIISDFQVSRLIGIVEDKDDYYWCLYDGRTIILSSCLTRVTPLKGCISNDDYNEMVRICKLNHYDQSIYSSLAKENMEEFIIEMHKQTLLVGWDKDTHFISGPDWNLN
jgi:hypothetical protein